jgi:hypothetical protein
VQWLCRIKSVRIIWSLLVFGTIAGTERGNFHGRTKKIQRLSVESFRTKLCPIVIKS